LSFSFTHFQRALQAGLFISRLHVFPIINVANLCRAEKITFPQQVFIWYGGLRGGICFILALGLGMNPNYRQEFRDLVLGSTVVIVFISVLVLGIGCGLMVNFLGLVKRTDDVEGGVPLKRATTFNRVFSK
jgi:NhaP-type Na+/H+ or K+/H+ antiporter